MKEMQNKLSKMPISEIIEKTILASVMNTGFWYRWIAHGIEEEFIQAHKTKMNNVTGWTKNLSNKASEHSSLAKDFEELGDLNQAEQHYCKAGIYLNLAQWVFPKPNKERADWYKRCLEQFKLADKVSEDEISYHTLTIENMNHGGRIRTPKGELSGVVVLIMPTDSTKEEFYLYEQDFVREGFVVISFDGPGQGETLLLHGHKADLESWEQFTNGVVEFSTTKFPNLPINLFGTSSGGAWAMEASRNTSVSKTCIVSPPPSLNSSIRLPEFFRERMSNMLVDIEKGNLPTFEHAEEINNILMFHGGKDLLVNEDDLIGLFDRLGPEKRFITYEDEDHCCNFKLAEIRHRTSKWFKGEEINEI